MPQTTCLHPALYCAAASIFLQLYLKPAVNLHISFSRSLFHVFFCYIILYVCGPAASTVVHLCHSRLVFLCIQQQTGDNFVADTRNMLSASIRTHVADNLLPRATCCPGVNAALYSCVMEAKIDGQKASTNRTTCSV